MSEQEAKQAALKAEAQREMQDQMRKSTYKSPASRRPHRANDEAPDTSYIFDNAPKYAPPDRTMASQRFEHSALTYGRDRPATAALS